MRYRTSARAGRWLTSILLAIGVATPAWADIVIEAESMTLTNYVTEPLSTRTLIKTTNAADGIATTTFTGAAGIYDIAITVVGETDGVSSLKVFRGSTPLRASYSYAQANTVQVFTITDVQLAVNDTIRLEGQHAPATNARVDKLTLTYKQASCTGYTPETGTTLAQAALTGVPTFESIGLYWKAATGPSATHAPVWFRKTTQSCWKKGYELWFDGRSGEPAQPAVQSPPEARRLEYRGSLVNLAPASTYDIKVVLDTGEYAQATLQTWDDHFRTATIVPITLPASGTSATLAVDTSMSGTDTAYTVVQPADANKTLDAANQYAYNINVTASHVIIRGFTLRGAQRHAIYVAPTAQDVIIENNDISGWGRLRTGSFGMDMDSGIGTSDSGSHDLKRLVIQNNRIHHPRYDTNSWGENPANVNEHPLGPQGITLVETGGNHVIRFNEIYSDADHAFNDCIGGVSNQLTPHSTTAPSALGAPGADSDIYGNKVSQCHDDGIEAEGGGQNVRIWGNYADHVTTSLAIATVFVGPIYLFRNVGYRHEWSETDTQLRGPFIKYEAWADDDHQAIHIGGGRVFVFHNTAYRTSSPIVGGAKDGLVGDDLLNFVVRNNILDVTGRALADTPGQGLNPPSDLAYDLYNATLSGVTDANGIHAVPQYDPNFAPYALAAGSSGSNDGTALPNFNDDAPDGPDRGAQERGGAVLQFGVR